MELNKKDQNSLSEALLIKQANKQSENLSSDLESNLILDREAITAQLRLGFIRKVYAILTAQLFLTSLFVVFGFNESVRQIYQSSFFLFYTAMFSSIILAVFLLCYPNLIRNVPTNYLVLVLWTACEGYLIGVISSIFDAYSVVMAASLTVTVTFALTVYAFTTKKDFTYIGGLLFVLVSIMIFFGLFFMLFGVNNKFTRALYSFYLVLGIVLYSFWLIYDTQLLMGKYGNEYSIDDYVIAAMMIYMDILQIFIQILQLIGSRRN